MYNLKKEHKEQHVKINNAILIHVEDSGHRIDWEGIVSLEKETKY